MSSLYLRGSCATGQDGPWSDVDLVFITDTGTIDWQEESRLFKAGRVQEIAGSRQVDKLVIAPGQLDINHLLANALRHGRLLAGEPVQIPVPNPLAWAEQADWFAGQLAAAPFSGARHMVRPAVLWTAAARLVKAGAPVPARKDDAAGMWADRVGGRWVDLLARTSTGQHIRAGEVQAFLADVHAANCGSGLRAATATPSARS